MNFQVGYTDNERNTSRILKPPGGGHTDIFGLNSPEDPTPKSTTKPKPKSQISEIFGGTEENGNANQKPVLKKQTSSIVLGDDENENKNSQTGAAQRKPLPPLPGHDTETDNSKADITMKTPNPKRIPPGGYSTSLW